MRQLKIGQANPDHSDQCPNVALKLLFGTCLFVCYISKISLM